MSFNADHERHSPVDLQTMEDSMTQSSNIQLSGGAQPRKIIARYPIATVGSRTRRGSSSDAMWNVRDPPDSMRRQAARSSRNARSGQGCCMGHHRVQDLRRAEHAGQAGAGGGYLGLVETVRQLTDEAAGTAVPGAAIGLVSGFGMINYDRGLASSAVLLARA